RQERQDRSGDRPHGRSARHIPATVAPHAIRHHQEQPGTRFRQVRRLDLHREETVFVNRPDLPDVRGEPETTTGRTNHGVRCADRPSVFHDLSSHAQDPLRRWPPLNAIVIYGPLPGLYTRATTSPSVSCWRLNPGICWYVLPPSCDMAVPFKLPKSSIHPRALGSRRSGSVGNRRFGSNAIALVATPESSDVTRGSMSWGDRKSSVFPPASCFMEARGSCPVRRKKNTAPTPYRSLAGVASPRFCSGAPQPGV